MTIVMKIDEDEGMTDMSLTKGGSAVIPLKTLELNFNKRQAKANSAEGTDCASLIRNPLNIKTGDIKEETRNIKYSGAGLH